MRIYCSGCFRSVSNELTEDAVLRAVVFCPECIEHVDDELFGTLVDQMRARQIKPSEYVQSRETELRLLWERIRRLDRDALPPHHLDES